MQANLQKISAAIRRRMSRFSGQPKYAMPQHDSASINMDAFHSTKQEMIRHDLSLCSSGTETDAHEEALRTMINECKIDVGASFVKHKATWTESKLYNVMHQMPKGGILHTHGISTGDLRKLVDFIVKEPTIYRWLGEDQEDGTIYGEFQFFLAKPKDELWEHCESAHAKKGTEYLEELYTSVHLQPEVPRQQCWGELNLFWGRTRHLSQCISFWLGTEKFFWTMLEGLLETGVTYVEIKEVITFPYRDADDGLKEVALEEVMKRFITVVEKFKKQYPRFIGAKIIWLSVKVFSQEEIMEDLDKCIALKKKFPDYIAGYDLAGHEDAMAPIGHFAEMLYIAKERAKSAGVQLPFMIHAGETHDPSNTQLYDAVLVGCDRIGHGYAIPRFPSVLDHVRATQTVIECCPLSNMSLGYVQDLSNHPGWTMLNHGLVLTISHDDPGMFGYWDVSYDWTAVTKAWGLRLVQLRKIGRDSLKHSTLSSEDKAKAIEQFEREFDAWVEAHF